MYWTCRGPWKKSQLGKIDMNSVVVTVMKSDRMMGQGIREKVWGSKII